MRGEVVLLGGGCGFAISSASLISGAAWTANTAKEKSDNFVAKAVVLNQGILFCRKHFGNV